MKPKKIALYGNFGSGNLGNECTLQVVIERLRRSWPDAQLLCIGADPHDIRARHQVPAARGALSDSRWTWAQFGRDATAPAPDDLTPPRPASRAAKALRIAFRRIPRELLHWMRGLVLLWRADMLLVPGTQIVSDYLCGPSGWPYDLFKWSTLAALCRAERVFLSIGVGPLHHPLSRWLIRRSLLGARYRSYRDEASRLCAAGLGLPAPRGAVFPDLVFSFSPARLGAETGSAAASAVVGLGLKDYAAADDAVHRQYLQTMAGFAAWLDARGYRVRLLIGDAQYDDRPRRELCALLQRRPNPVHPLPIEADASFGVADLLAQLRATELVVSPRLHNLILAALLGKPLLALSDHSKLDALLAGFGLTEYCVPLENLSLDTLVGRFQALERDAVRVKAQIHSTAARYREALEAQYSQVFPAAGAAP